MELIGGLAQMMEAHAPKAYYNGTERVCSPEETLARVIPHFKSFGITRLADVTGLDRIGIPIVQAFRPMSHSLSVKQGKGRTLNAAFASGAMEAIEAWHGENIPKDAFVPLPDGVEIAETCLLGFGKAEMIDHAALHWSIGLNLLSGRAAAVPQDLVSLNFTEPRQCDAFQKSSNGLASGNTLAEAVCAALCEVIERDCIAEFEALPWQAQASRRVPKEALMTYGTGDLCEMIEKADVFLECWDITSELGVPAFRAILYEVGNSAKPEQQPWISPPQTGYGCHLNPAVAASRAITEAAQSRLVLIAGSRDDLVPEHYIHPKDANRNRLLSELVQMSVPRKPYEALQSMASESCEEDIEILLVHLAKAGLAQVILCDLTHAGFSIPVVRAICPGLGRLLPGDKSQRALRPLQKNGRDQCQRL